MFHTSVFKKKLYFRIFPFQYRKIFEKHNLYRILLYNFQFVTCKFNVVAFSLYLVAFLPQYFGNIYASVAVLSVARFISSASYSGVDAR